MKQQEQKKTNVRKFISVVKKYTDMIRLDNTILREFVEQVRVSETYGRGTAEAGENSGNRDRL